MTHLIPFSNLNPSIHLPIYLSILAFLHTLRYCFSTYPYMSRLLQVDAILQAVQGIKGYIVEHGCTTEKLNEWVVAGEERGLGLEEEEGQGPEPGPGPELVQGITSLSINNSSSSSGVGSSSSSSSSTSCSIASSSSGNGSSSSSACGSSSSTSSGGKNTRVSVIFLGDLNSTPETAAIEYLHTGDHPPSYLPVYLPTRSLL